MAYSDDATKSWVSATPTKNADGHVIKWKVKYKYKLNSFTHIFDDTKRITSPSKTPGSYTKSELLNLMNEDHWNLMFNKKYAISIADEEVVTTDDSFNVNSLG